MADPLSVEVDERQVQAEVSRRLKAARWLAGGIDEKGRPAPLSPQELAAREPLVRNGITANAIMEIEQLIRRPRPMELRTIAEALGLRGDWFTAGIEFTPPTVARLTQAILDSPGSDAITGEQLRAQLRDVVADHIQPIERQVTALSNLLVLDLKTHRDLAPQGDVEEAIRAAEQVAARDASVEPSSDPRPERRRQAGPGR